MVIAWHIILIIVLLLASGFISGSETALTSLSKDDLARIKGKYPGSRKSFLFWQEYPSRVLAIILIGNNFSNIGLGVVAASLAINVSLISGIDKGLLLVLIPGIVMVLILLFAEIFPKILARHKREQFSIYCVGVLVFLVKCFNSFISFLVWLSDTIIKFLGIRGLGDGVFLSSRELKNIFSSKGCGPVPAADSKYVAGEHGMEIGLTSDTRQILRNIINFSDTAVSEIMTPRTEMFTVSLSDKAENIIRMIYDQGYSRVPVYERSIDNITGVIYAKDLLNAWRNQSLIFLHDILRPVYFVPENASVTEVLRDFKKGRNHLAIVVDEYGGTAGIVTIEDALEEIIGEIYDEYDEKVTTIIREKAGVWVVDAVENLDKINESLYIDLPSEKYENLASFLLRLFGRLPKKGEIRYHGRCKFEIAKVDRKRIYKVRISTEG